MIFHDEMIVLGFKDTGILLIVHFKNNFGEAPCDAGGNRMVGV